MPVFRSQTPYNRARPPSGMQGMRIIIAFILALQPCMVGNEISLIRSFSILMCKTRLSLQSVKTGQM